MKSKKTIVTIIVCLLIAVVAVFVVPSSNSYLSEVTVSGEKKKGYSLYKSTSISNKSDDSKIKEYARVDKDSFKKLASSTNYVDYDQLDYWN